MGRKKRKKAIAPVVEPVATGGRGRIRRNMRTRYIYFVIIAVALLVIVGGLDFDRRFGGDEESRDSYTASADAGDSLVTLTRLQQAQRIVNAHEHLQSMREAELLLQVMDAYGVRKSVLMGSSWFTITLDESVGFTRYLENNDELIRIANAHPDRFEAWPTLNPEDEGNVARLAQYAEAGATGLKLYLGHGYVKRSDGQYMFHTMALDDPRMLPVYAWCEENYFPIMFHVQPSPITGPGIADEFVSVLTQFPDMKVIAPHYILSSVLDSRLLEFLATFPNLYSDISYGHDSFIKAGIERISKDPEKFRDIFEQYPDRFVWGTDLVITNYAGKSVDWMGVRFQTYFDMLTKPTYVTPIVPGEVLNGLALPGEMIENLLYKNYEQFMALEPEGTQITREINWSKMGRNAKVDRAPGETLPPPRK